MQDFFIARQPIFDSSLRLYAYELLFRTADTSAAPLEFDDNQATAQVLMTSEEFGVGKLVGEHLAFINLPQRFLAEPDLLPMQPDNVVLEVLEHVSLNDSVIAGMQILTERGYTLALDDYVDDERYEAVLPYVSIVKLEIPLIPPEDWGKVIRRLKALGVRILAEKVETNEEFEQLSQLGCDYFQGYFFARPNIVSGKRLSPNKLALLQLIAQINDSEIDVESLSELVSRDVALSVRAMNYVNSAGTSLTRRIESVREAVVYIGRETLRRWVTLFLMANIDDKPGELITTALIRAKFMELLAKESGQSDMDAFFTIGLFSLLDALMDSPMTDVLASLSLSPELEGALRNRQGIKGAALNLAVTLELGKLEAFEDFKLSETTVAELHLRATQWADETLAGMHLN